MFLAVFAVFLIATALCVAATMIGVASAQPSHHDTQWFWASGHLLVHGENPYDREAVRQIEKTLGLPVHGSYVPMTLNPPYTFFLLIPLGLFGPRTGMVAWALALAAFLVISVRIVTAMARGSDERPWSRLAWCFAPALLCIEMGQTGLIVLLGLVLFLRLHDRRPLWAGAALSLCAVKPHLLLPFGVILLAWIVVRKRWSILAGAAAAIAVESAIAMIFDHAIWNHYRAMMHTEGFVGYFIPTLGVALRFVVDRTAMWLEFVPAAMGCVWGLWYFWRNREKWDWRTHGSLLTLVSLVVAPYSWFTDQVIALPAILFVLLGAEMPRRGSLTLLLAVMTAAALEMLLAPSLYSKIYIVQAVAWLAWYLYATTGRAPARETLAAGLRSGDAVSG